MDNVTHTLTGLALARAGLNRFSPRAVALLILSESMTRLQIVGGLLIAAGLVLSRGREPALVREETEAKAA